MKSIFQQHQIIKNMETKLYVYKLKLPFEEKTSAVYSALAESQIEAQVILLERISNEHYRNQLRRLFASGYEPTVFSAGEVFIQLTGELNYFTH